MTVQSSKGIGWIDDEHVYLVPELAWNSVEEFNWREGWPYRKTQLHKQLADQSIIEREDGADEAESRLTCLPRLGGSNPRVFKVHVRHFEDAIPDPTTLGRLRRPSKRSVAMIRTAASASKITCPTTA